MSATIDILCARTPLAAHARLTEMAAARKISLRELCVEALVRFAEAGDPAAVPGGELLEMNLTELCERLGVPNGVIAYRCVRFLEAAAARQVTPELVGFLAHASGAQRDGMQTSTGPTAGEEG